MELVDLNDFKEILPDDAEMPDEILDYEEEEAPSQKSRPKAVQMMKGGDEEPELPAKRPAES